jgi:outer membrane lipoprotein-sorting protein
MKCSSLAALLLAVLNAATLGAEEPRGELTIEILMDHMSRAAGVKARFLERKEVSLLVAPLESQGALYFIPPDRFARHTTKPGRTLLVIDGNTLRYFDEFGGEQIDLSGEPIARQFVENLTGLFNGDLPALRERYHVTFQSEGDLWQLVLQPRSENMRKFIRDITLRGDGPALLEMRMVENDGDSSTTTFTEIQTDYRFSELELETAFPSRLATEQAEIPGP